MFTAPTPFQWLAPSIFTLDLAVQIYGIFASPSLSDVHYANLSIFSPNLSFVIVGFSPLQLLQVIWLWKIWRSGFNPPFIQHDPVDKDGQLMLAYVPYFVLCHICLAGKSNSATGSKSYLHLLAHVLGSLEHVAEFLSFNMK